MTKKKKNYALWTVICLVSILAVGTIGVIAFSNNSTIPPTTLIENAGGVTINNPVQPSPVEDVNLGAVTSADALPAMVCSSDLCTYTATGAFMDASTTIVSIADPFVRATSSNSEIILSGTINNGIGLTGATSTVSFAMLNITTAATSTFGVSCGAASSTGSTIGTATNNEIITHTANNIATSTTGVLVNGLTRALGGIADAGTVRSISIGGTFPYLTCVIVSVYPGAFTEVTNAFDGKFAVTFTRTR